MTSREGLRAVLEGRRPDHVPLTTWCFGRPAPPGLRWELDGQACDDWYSLRTQRLHTTRVCWTLKTLGPTGRFILHPVDALFPDTPRSAVQAMIPAWAEGR